MHGEPVRLLVLDGRDHLTDAEANHLPADETDYWELSSLIDTLIR